MKTIDYYNQYADEFTQATVHVDMKSLYQPFLDELPERAWILDVGCGSGRDTLAFKNKDYQVDAIDYSNKLVNRAIQLTGVQVKLKSFYEINEHEVYDGIWACASLLHCERDRLGEQLEAQLSPEEQANFKTLSAKEKDEKFAGNSEYATALANEKSVTNKWGMGGDYSRGLNAVTTALTAVLGGQTDLQAVANTLAPYAAQVIGQEFGHGADTHCSTVSCACNFGCNVSLY